MIPFPDKKYNILYLDPPWTYNDKCHSGQRGVEYKYDVMTLEDLSALPVGDIAADNCVMFMWVTMPQLPVCFGVAESYGFTYKTTAFTWIKMNKKADTPFFGMGNWTRANAELCLLFTKGKPKRVSASVRQVIMSKIEEHSKKPAEVRDRIVELCGDLPRIELFARQRVTGWDHWGLEV